MAEFKRGHRWLAFAVGLLGSLTAVATAEARSPVWALRGDHNTVYLAGSVHLLRGNDATLPAAIHEAYEDSDALVMEVDLDDMNPLEAQAWMLEHGMYGEDGSLRRTLGTMRFVKVQVQSSRLGLPVDAIERFEPWMAAMTLAQLAYVQLGFDPEEGVEKQLERRALYDHKEITGFETLQEQLAMLDELSQTDQIKFLDLTLAELKEMEGETESLLEAWRNGNSRKLSKLLSEQYRAAPTLYRTLVSDRNSRWMPRLEELLHEDKNYLVVVGALHLVGRGGLLQLARSRGIKARQLQ